jgi:hypothetical protein
MTVMSGLIVTFTEENLCLGTPCTGNTVYKLNQSYSTQTASESSLVGV